jgi:hypothetical protein
LFIGFGGVFGGSRGGSKHYIGTDEVDFSIDTNVKVAYKAVLSYARLSGVVRESSKPNLGGMDYRHSTRTARTSESKCPGSRRGAFRPAKREEAGD